MPLHPPRGNPRPKFGTEKIDFWSFELTFIGLGTRAFKRGSRALVRGSRDQFTVRGTRSAGIGPTSAGLGARDQFAGKNRRQRALVHCLWTSDNSIGIIGRGPRADLTDKKKAAYSGPV